MNERRILERRDSKGRSKFYPQELRFFGLTWIDMCGSFPTYEQANEWITYQRVETETVHEVKKIHRND